MKDLVWIAVQPGTTLTVGRTVHKEIVIDDQTAYRTGNRLYATAKVAELLGDRFTHPPHKEAA
jgi:hypothetical protein